MSRLIVVDGPDLRVVTMGSGHSHALPAHPSRTLANRQPVWSPDGREIAWSAFDRRQADSPTFVSIALADGSRRVDHPTVFPAFYLHWRPDGGALATLSEGPLGIELTVLDPASGDGSIVTRGSPLFFDWSSDGSLCIHTGRSRDQRLELHRRAGGPDPFQSLTPRAFGAPAWCADEHVVLVVRSEARHVLALVDRHAHLHRVLAAIDGHARFVVSPGCRRVAWIDSTARHRDPAAARSDVHDGLRRAHPDELIVHDIASDVVQTVTDTPVAAFFWADDGDTLVFASIRERGEHPLLQWHVWRNGDTRSFAPFRPSNMLTRDYLPFADQYARGVSWTSPDGQAFCYAGTDLHGREGIWVQALDRGAPEHVTTGQYAAWSPR